MTSNRWNLKAYHSFISKFGTIKKPHKLKRESIGGFTGDSLVMDDPTPRREEAEEVKIVLHAAMEELRPRERYVLRLRWLEGMTTASAARAMGISKERSRQIESKALDKLFHLLRLTAKRRGWIQDYHLKHLDFYLLPLDPAVYSSEF
jgi:DNA-directed RNA polymerase sigma subunit (sigma70/sigma32)